MTETTYIVVCRIWSFLIQYRYIYWKRYLLWQATEVLVRIKPGFSRHFCDLHLIRLLRWTVFCTITWHLWLQRHWTALYHLRVW